MVKCVHRKIKDALCACGAGLAWHSHLPWVLLGLHAVPKEDSMVSSAKLVLEHPFILPRQLLHVPDPPHVDIAPLPMKPASYAAAADSPPAHLARVEYMYLRVGGKQLAGAQMPARTGCWPRGKDLQDPDQAKGGDPLSGCPKAPHICAAPMDPAEATCLGRPAKSQPALQSSLQLHEDADWGEGPCRGAVCVNYICLK
jgi:hypothetical protein